MTDEIEIKIFTPEDYIIIDETDLPEILDLSYLGSDQYKENELEIIRLTNEERQRMNLSPLRRNERLCQSALMHTLDMVEHRFISHTGSDGTDLKYRIEKAGYRRYRLIGENLATGQMTPKEAVTGWMNSPGHRANILRPEFNEIGVAYILGEVKAVNNHVWLKGGYWTQHFGCRVG